MINTDKHLISTMTLNDPLREWNIFKHEETYICEEILYIRNVPTKTTSSAKFSEIYDFFDNLDTRYAMVMFNSVKL